MAVWFITGASRGLGREVARKALRHGDKVVATARSTKDLAPLVEIDREHVLTVQLDVTSPEQIAEAVARANEEFGRIDVLFNNAGICYLAAVEGLSEALDMEVAPLDIRVVLVEPSGFVTDWAGSSFAEAASRKEIDDYADTAGAQRTSFRENVGKEPGDPARAAKAIVDVAHDAAPPKRLPLGNFAYDGILEKLDAVRTNIAAREAVSRGADRS